MQKIHQWVKDLITNNQSSFLGQGSDANPDFFSKEAWAGTGEEGGAACQGASPGAGCDGGADGDDPWSTPFLLTWNGKKFVHENDFLYGKPGTAFHTREEGEAAYKKGLGGDTYLLQNEIVPQNGELKLEIHEVEPEESCIDTFSLHALDLQKNEIAVVGDDLETLHVFDTQKSVVPEDQTLYHYHGKKNTFTRIDPAYIGFDRSTSKEVMLDMGDEIIVRVPITDKEYGDTYLMLDSYFRDWMLGDHVPFSRLESFLIQTHSLKHAAIASVAGVALSAMPFFGGNAPDEQHELSHLLKMQPSIAYADASCNSCSTGGGGGGGGTCGGGTMSLVVTAHIGDTAVYLQTVLPRYVQATQEALRIPAELIEKAKGAFLTLRIRATKNHKVVSAFVFEGTPKEVVPTKLKLTKAVMKRTGKDYATVLENKDGNFLTTEPADVVELAFTDVSRQEGLTRKYLLRANGFYSGMRAETQQKLGDTWYKKLPASDRKLLRNLKSLARY